MKSVLGICKKIYRKFIGVYRFHVLISRAIDKRWTILDVGCGRQSVLSEVKKGVHLVGLDNYEPYIHKSRQKGIHDEYVFGDARALPFTNDSFDCVIAIEVLEHLSKEDGIKMLKEMERVARKRIILTTPNGFLPTYAGLEDNPSESHLSGWNARELQKLGFKVRGLSGSKIFWKISSGQAVTKFKPGGISTFFLDISEILVYFYPGLAFQLFFLKNLSKERHENNISAA